MRRDWTAARRAHLGDPCAVCGQMHGVELAHLVPRAEDARDPETGRRQAQGTTVEVDPLRILPLCGPATDTGTCHHGLDTGAIDVLPILERDYPEKVLECVRALTLEGAYRRLAPSAYRKVAV